MRIKKTTTFTGQTIQSPQESSGRTAGSDKSGSGKGASKASDRVQLSKGYQGVAQAQKTIMEEGDLRTEEIERLRGVIESNEYTVEPVKVAEKMLEEIL